VSDGGYAAIDYNNPNNVYATQQQLVIDKSTSGPRGSFLAADNGIPPSSVEPRQFIAPLVMDPNNPLVLYAGTDHLYRTTNGAGSWVPISPALTTGTDSFSAISAIGVARGASGTLYVGTGSGGVAGKLWVTTDGGATWTDRTAGLPNRSITAVAVHPTNASVAYLTVSGFDAGHVWKTTDGGATWADVSAGLPNAPANAVTIDPNDGQIVYVGTDVGVFKTSVGGSAWGALNAGLPNVVVDDVVLNQAGTRLFAFTHGRGVFVSDRTIVAATPTPVVRPTPTPTPTPPPICSPRPRVSVTVAPGQPGRLQVTIGSSAAANAYLFALQFGAATNALIDVPGQPPGQSGSFTVRLPPATQQTQFTVRRATAGQATTVPLTVVDSCGAWPTLVGGGPSAF
jgi:ligand-binding sensor domain-containing protein